MSTFSLGFTELLLAGRMRQAGCDETWTFEISLPVLPPRRSFLIAAGLDQAVAMLERLAESGPDLSDLEAGRLPAPLDAAALEAVSSLRFTGSVEAVPEGTVIFAGEPVVRLRAPAPEAVLVGAALVGLLRSQTAVATKAARLVLAAAGKPVYELGVRSAAREAALLAARSAHVGGASATSNAVASMEFGLPTLPVVPLSLVAALGGSFAGLEACGVLVDGALASEGEAALAALSETPRAVILDASTKNLAERVKSLRAGIQSLGWRGTKVLLGGRVDEDVIDEMESHRVELDGYCVGGELVVAIDSPCIGFDYELVEREMDGQKHPLPRRDGGIGRRSVWRRREAGRFKADTVQPETKPPPSGGVPLLVRVMEKGRRMFRAPSLSELRVLCNSQLSMLDPAVTRRTDPATYSVTVTVEPKKQAEPPRKAPEPKAAPRAAPKGESIRADEARRRALSQIDDSADFTAVSGAFESVVAANLGDGADEETPAEPVDETVAASTDDEAASDAGADEGTEEGAPSESAEEDGTSADASADEGVDESASEEPVEPVEPTEEGTDYEAGEEPQEGEPPEASDASESEGDPLEEESAPVAEHDGSEGDEASGDDVVVEPSELGETADSDEAADSESSDGEPNDHDLVSDVSADGSEDSSQDEEAPARAAPVRGAAQKGPAATKAPPPKPAAPKFAQKPAAPKAVAPKKPVAAVKPVAPKKGPPPKPPVAEARPTAAKPVAAKPAPVKPASTKPAPTNPVMVKPVAPPPTQDEPPLPSFGAEPFSSNGSPTPVASNSNPLLAAAARLRSMQRGETPPATAPVVLESASTPAAPAAAPTGELPANPLLAAALRLKSLRGS